MIIRNSRGDTAMCVFVKRVSKRGLVSVGLVSPCIIVVGVTSEKGGSNIKFSVKQLVTKRKEKIHQADVYSTTLHRQKGTR